VPERRQHPRDPPGAQVIEAIRRRLPPTLLFTGPGGGPGQRGGPGVRKGTRTVISWQELPSHLVETRATLAIPRHSMTTTIIVRSNWRAPGRSALQRHDHR
jgi:hypothetical protein